MSAIDLAPLGIQVAPPSHHRAPTTRIYGAPLTDEAIARCRRAAGHKEKPMDIETAKTEPAPPPEDEHAHDVEPVRYCLQSEGDPPSWLTMPEIVKYHAPAPAVLDAIRLLAPGEEHYDHGMDVVVQRPKRVRMVVVFEIDACDAADVRLAGDAMLDESDAQQCIDTYDYAQPMRVVVASVESCEVQP